MRRLFASTALTLAFAVAAAAQQDDIERLADVLGLPEVIEVMAQEGLVYGDELEAEMFPGRGGRVWDELVQDLYDAGEMRRVVVEGLTEGLRGVDLEPLFAFFTSPRGEAIIRLEIEARQALLDDDVEDAAKRKLDEMRADDDPRLDLLTAYAEANDLVEQNVVGAMNANYALYAGLMDGGAFRDEMTEDQVLGDVWAQEPEIRASTIDWVYSYLGLAYQPLENADIEAYTDLSRTGPGEAMNDALFMAFDRMYREISRDLGAGAARFLLSEDI